MWTLTRAATSFERHLLTDSRSLQKVKEGGKLSGGPGDWGITGWFEYDFAVPRTAWYELFVLGSGAGVDFLLDPQMQKFGGEVRIYGGAGAKDGKEKISNLWLTAGAHTLRLQRYFWTGFPAVSGFTVRASPSTALAATLRIESASRIIHRINECEPLVYYSGGRGTPTRLTIRVEGTTFPAFAKSYSIAIPASADLEKREFDLPCNMEGRYRVSFGEGDSGIPYPDVRPVYYEVIDTTVNPQSTGKLKKTLVQTIDCAQQAPDYSGGGETRVTRAPWGSYRESGELGWTRYQRLPETARKFAPEPSWFAYRLDSVKRQEAYVVEVDYPDDKLRTFGIALRESDPLSYPVAGGVDSGGEYSLSHAMQTHTLLFWPRAMGTRVTLINAHDGRRAAASRIRVYRVDGDLPTLADPVKGGRDFINWYEEGDNFTSMYGAPDETPASKMTALERWARAVAYAGGNVLSPTVVVYSFAMYPSQYNQAFSQGPDDDMLRRMLLVSEKYGLRLLPELHPRADELAWPVTPESGSNSGLLLSKDGRTSYFAGDGKSRNYPPYYNPLNSANQDWYVGMIGELVDQYRDSPALIGVRLRLMPWANPALNNFPSLDWGYDDDTVGRFQRDTGIRIAVDDDVKSGASPAVKARAYYRWLMANAREAWIDWRCRKIAELYTRIRDRVRQARPDLRVYLPVFPWNTGGSLASSLRESGIDAQLLSGIDGLVLVNAAYTYGRREAEADPNIRNRDALLQPVNLISLTAPGQPGRFLSSANYLEATEAVVPPAQIGFPPSTKNTWMSAAANPAGRHALERYAVELAETDAFELGDGGNGYSLGQPPVRDFMAEFRRLPARKFTPRQDARDPVAVWTLKQDREFTFYAVNRERYPIKLRFMLNGAQAVTRLVTGERMEVQSGAMELQLQPYQVLAFKAAAGASIAQITTIIPDAELEKARTQVEWLKNLGRSIDGDNLDGLTQDQIRAVHQAAAEAAEAFVEKRLWRARTMLESYQLMKIYERIHRYPPGLRDYGGS